MGELARRPKKALAAAPPVIHPTDRLSRLPDEILAQILSFLPAQEAVRTCILARAWRDVWKLTRRLLITWGTAPAAREFVNRLLRLRRSGLECTPLDECDIMLRMDDDSDTRCAVHRWIRRSLKCRVQALRVLNENEPHRAYVRLSETPLASPHLTRLELSRVRFKGSVLNLDGCPALEHLEIRSCLLFRVRKIMSPSLKRLVITGCISYGDHRRFTISTPCLVSLWLVVENFRTPILESMPELVEAYVKISHFSGDNCYCDEPIGCHHVMWPAGDISDPWPRRGSDSDVDSNNEEDSDTDDYPGPNAEGCVLLEGLAQAKDLVLLASRLTYIFRRDLRWCPTFYNLKTLVLNGYWCEPADYCRALACILEHAPVLEKLTVLFSDRYVVEHEYPIVWAGHLHAAAKSTMTTQCLETVKVKCHSVHEEVQNVLKFLSTLNIFDGMRIRVNSPMPEQIGALRRCLGARAQADGSTLAEQESQIGSPA